MNPTPNIFSRIKTYITTHKFISFVALVVLALVIYWIVKAATPTTTTTTYVVGQATTGTIVSTVSGTGQVSTTNSLAITPQTSGAVTQVNVKSGDSVSKGETMFVIDPTNAEESVATAKSNLESAQLALQSDEISDNNSESDQSTSVAEAYNNLLNSNPQAVPVDANTTTYDAPNISGNYSLGKQGIITLTTYASAGGYSFTASGLTTGNSLVSSAVPQPIGDSGLTAIFPSKVAAGLSWTITLPNTDASNYSSNENSYQSALTAQSEADVTSPNNTTAINLAKDQLSINQAQQSLTEAEQTLSDCYVTAPFSGIVATTPVIVGEQASSGTTLTTLISNQEVANISLNEVDAANVKLGDKATMTFDAVPNLTITGEVNEIDSVGTVSQGVVSYNVQITFDTQDPTVKSGMSVTADIATDVEQNVVIVPSTAIKTSGSTSYVLTVPSGTPVSTGNTGETLTGTSTPTETVVTTGISDDTNTEITSGLSAGDEVVTKTTTTTGTTKAAAKTATPSILSSLGGGGAGRAAGGGGYAGGGAR